MRCDEMSILIKVTVLLQFFLQSDKSQRTSDLIWVQYDRPRRSNKMLHFIFLQSTDTLNVYMSDIPYPHFYMTRHITFTLHVHEQTFMSVGG